MNGVFLLHDNTRLNTGPSMKEAKATMGWTVLRLPHYSPDLPPSEFCLFGPLKGALPAQDFADNSELKHSLLEKI